MKKCGYCGRENAEEAGRCQECGTSLVDPPADAKPAPIWPEWLRHALRYVGIILLIGVFYLLSLGPVERYCGTVTSRSPMPTTLTTNDQGTIIRMGTVRTVSYPRWVSIVYYPVIRLRSGSGGSILYERYLEWWDKSDSH